MLFLLSPPLPRSALPLSLLDLALAIAPVTRYISRAFG
ncbi:hypothetical protein SOVF_114730 [Spinacia oleracea]|nr:hypothetical protein SOVF_114730 [Spinacia oleracea]